MVRPEDIPYWALACTGRRSAGRRADLWSVLGRRLVTSSLEGPIRAPCCFSHRPQTVDVHLKGQYLKSLPDSTTKKNAVLFHDSYLSKYSCLFERQNSNNRILHISNRSITLLSVDLTTVIFLTNPQVLSSCMDNLILQ